MARRARQESRPGEPVKVAVAVVDKLVRDAIGRLVAADPSFTLVGTAADAEVAVEVAHRHQADIVVVDVRIPKGNGLRVVRELSVLAPSTRVLALSGYGDRKHVVQMLDAGAAGYLVESATLDLLGALRVVGRGERVLSREIRGDGTDAPARLRLGAPGPDAVQIAETIDSRSFTVAFQPIFSLDDGSAAGLEALARLSPDHGLPPDLWLSEAWAVGLGPDIELAVLGAAGARSRGRPPGRFLSVNVSPRLLLDDRFDALVTGPDRPHDLVVELTEHDAVRNYGMLNERLDELRRHGVRVAVDDVGGGYASLRHVLELRPDVVKLDVSLTAEIDRDRSRRVLAAGLVALSAELGASVVAEGIETPAQLRCLRALGVQHGQGYYLAQPGPFEDAVHRHASFGEVAAGPVFPSRAS